MKLVPGFISLIIVLFSACKPEPFAFNTQIEGSLSLKHSSEAFANESIVLLLDGKELQRTKTDRNGKFRFTPFPAKQEQNIQMYLLKPEVTLDTTLPFTGWWDKEGKQYPFFTCDEIGYNIISTNYATFSESERAILEQGYTFLPPPTAGLKNKMQFELIRTTEVKLHFRYPPGSNPPFFCYFGFEQINTVPYPTVTSFETFTVPREGRTFTIKHLPEKSEVTIPFFYTNQSFQTVYDQITLVTGSAESIIEREILIQ
jgi:hypothetical protein